ncbi:unnamed protein product [Effrenium voratum]|nr:unnamed protein product [Effrenium voratum]
MRYSPLVSLSVNHNSITTGLLKETHPPYRQVAEMKAQQVEEMTSLRTGQLEELAALEVQWTTQVSDLRSRHSEEIRSLKSSLEETHRRSQRMLLERDDAREQLLSKQREGSRLQQQSADARHEVLELSAQVRSQSFGARGLNRSLSASFLDSPVHSMSLQDARQVDAEMLDLRRRCQDLERLCSRMHGLLERGQEACERWRREGISAKSELLALERLIEPFELGAEL